MELSIVRENKRRGWDREYQKNKRLLGLVNKTLEYRRWRKKNPLAYQAHKEFHIAVKKGLIIRQKVCEMVDETCSRVIQAHHPDYKKPLTVAWLCASHHKKVDLGIIKLKKL